MKLRSKLLMAAVSLLTVSVAATATSAYAWYAANRQTNASVSNVSVRSTETSIKVSLVNDATKSPDFVAASSNTNESGESATKRYSISTKKSVSDVSGIGDGNFVKPYLDAAGTSVVGWHNPDSVKANFYKFTLNFSATGGDKAVNLYFSGSSTITTGDTSSETYSPDDLSIPSAARLSAVVSNKQKLVYLPTGVEKHTYTDGKLGEVSSDYTGALSTLTSKEAGAALDFKQGTPDLSTNTTDTTKCHGLLGPVTPSIGGADAVDLEVTFYLWVEGTATTLGNTNTTATATLVSNLDFYTI